MRTAALAGVLLVLLGVLPAHAQMFSLPDSVELHPEVEDRLNRVLASVVVMPNVLPLEHQQNLLEYDLRERDRMRYLQGSSPTGVSLGYGAAIFAATSIVVARAPRAVRDLFSGPTRFGPAVLDGGGLGAGLRVTF